MGEVASKARCDDSSYVSDEPDLNYGLECTCTHCYNDEMDPQVLNISVTSDLDSSIMSMNDTFPRLLGQFKPSRTITIFDWDDTLLCSSALRAQNVKFEHLEQLEKAVASLLEAAMAVGETLIVTNGTETWVQESSSHFLPGLVPMLQSLHVTSARAQYEHLYPGDPFMWKRACFRDLLADERRGILAHAKELNLVVCGDSLAEIQAAHGALDDLHCPSLVKTVKFKEIPTIAELLGQIRRLTTEFAKIADADSTINKSLVQRTHPNNSAACMTTCATGWELSDHLSWDLPGPPAVF